MKSALTKIIGIAAAVFILPSLASAATLSVSPASQAVKTGETFTVSVKLDTQGSSIDGVDLRYLNFNPRLLQVVDANASQSGVQVNADSLMPLTVLNSADNASGKIAFSQVATGGTKYKGSGILATVTFKAIAPGTANLTFNYTPNSTTDSNIAAGGSDILNAVINGSYSLSGSVVAVPPSPTTVPVVSKPANANAVPEQTGAPLPETDTTPLQFSEQQSFWQIFVAMIKEYYGSFIGRVKSIRK